MASVRPPSCGPTPGLPRAAAAGVRGVRVAGGPAPALPWRPCRTSATHRSSAELPATGRPATRSPPAARTRCPTRRPPPRGRPRPPPAAGSTSRTSTKGAARGGTARGGRRGGARPARPVPVAVGPAPKGFKELAQSRRPGDRALLAAFVISIVSALFSLLVVQVDVDDRGELIPYSWRRADPARPRAGHRPRRHRQLRFPDRGLRADHHPPAADPGAHHRLRVVGEPAHRPGEGAHVRPHRHGGRHDAVRRRRIDPPDDPLVRRTDHARGRRVPRPQGRHGGGDGRHRRFRERPRDRGRDDRHGGHRPEVAAPAPARPGRGRGRGRPRGRGGDRSCRRGRGRRRARRRGGRGRRPGRRPSRPTLDTNDDPLAELEAELAAEADAPADASDDDTPSGNGRGRRRR